MLFTQKQSQIVVSMKINHGNDCEGARSIVFTPDGFLEGFVQLKRHLFHVMRQVVAAKRPHKQCPTVCVCGIDEGSVGGSAHGGR